MVTALVAGSCFAPSRSPDQFSGSSTSLANFADSSMIAYTVSWRRLAKCGSADELTSGATVFKQAIFFDGGLIGAHGARQVQVTVSETKSGQSPLVAACLELTGQLWHGLEEISDQPVVGHAEDRRVRDPC